MAEIHLSIQVLSDLHLEAPPSYDIFEINAKSPVLALLGDIGQVKDEHLFAFLKQQLKSFHLVFFLLGNHEPYDSDWRETRRKVKEFQVFADALFRAGQLRGEFIFLDQTRYDLSDIVTVLGCTLFSNPIPEQKEVVSFGMNDFYMIKDWTIEKHQSAHESDLAWLNGQVESIGRDEPHRKIVILSHYCPCTLDQVIDPRHANSKISSGFMTDLTAETCWTAPNVKVWAFGHTHFNCDFEDDKTGKRVLANQRGYYFAQAASYDGEKIIEL